MTVAEMAAEINARSRAAAEEWYGELEYLPTGAIRVVRCPNCTQRTAALVGRWMRCPCGTEHYVE